MECNVAELLKDKKRLHFVGIGGSGMFPIVEILHGEGYRITGSDVNEGDIIEKERALGIPVTIGHDAKNVGDAELLVVTAALIGENPEVKFATEHGIPVVKRADMLGYITSLFPRSVCISGTHGKTTTTSLVTSIFMLAGRDPAAVVGGKLPLIHGYGRTGKSDIVVVEACEYVDTFLHLTPAYPVILNVDADHLDYFGSLDGIKKSFRRFAELAGDKVFANGDDANTLDTLKGTEKKVVWFGYGDNCDYRIVDVRIASRAFYTFGLLHNGKSLGEFTLRIPGKQNVYNAAAAAAVATEFGCTPDEIRAGFESFKGAGRRFELVGEEAGVAVFDDYAHHPAEISVTLDAAKDMGYRRVIAVFQPFTYTRTYQHLDSFAAALSKADKVVLTEIMGSREINTLDIYSKDLCEKIPGGEWFGSFDNVAKEAAALAGDGDMIITLGCGDVYKVARMILKNLSEI